MKRLFTSEAFAVLKVEDYRFYLFYRFFISSANVMQSVIVGWHVYNLTKNVLFLAMIGLTEVIPQVSIALFAGYFIDLWDRKKIIIFSTFLLILGTIILLFYSIPFFHSYEKFGIAPLFITIFISGLSRGVLAPANTAIMGQLVPRELYANAATWNSISWQVAAVVGPAIGGIIYGIFNIVTAYATVLVFYLISFIWIMFISKRPILKISTNESIFNSIRKGIRFVFDTKILLGAFTLDMFAVFFGGAVSMLPVFASDILLCGPQGLGFLRASPAIGAIIMSTILVFYPPVKHTGKYLLYTVAGFGVCMIGFAVSKNFYLSVALLIFSGLFDNVSVVIRGTILQLYTPDEMRGRVGSVNSIFIGSSNELGAFESGVAARLLGLIPSVIFGGVMTLIVVGITTKLTPSLRKLSIQESMGEKK